ncbi:sulfite exporter TauE/SafE family protein [Oenococcus oeni]|uniref:sulfite exporter TauE/SafE family protein n=1 Tax=Oenococcus oeni TaxID=1247 RepID=UPI0009B56791
MSIGILAGVFGAVLGLGGGMIVTPILVLGFNLPIHYAIAASIIAVIGTSSDASVAYLKDDLLNIRVAMFLEIFTTIGALIGAVLVGIFKASWLNAFFGFLLLYQGFAMWQKMHSKKADTLALKDDTAAASALIYFFNGTIQPLIVAPIAIGIIFGSTLGSKVMPYLPNKLLRGIFIPVVVLAGVQLVIKALGINLY